MIFLFFLIWLVLGAFGEAIDCAQDTMKYPWHKNSFKLFCLLFGPLWLLGAYLSAEHPVSLRWRQLDDATRYAFFVSRYGRNSRSFEGFLKEYGRSPEAFRAKRKRLREEREAFEKKVNEMKELGHKLVPVI